MKTLAVLSRKGGTGKTTLALHLSVAAVQAGLTTLLVDLDPQASAVSWSDRRESETPVVISAHAARLPDLLQRAAENGVAFCDHRHCSACGDRGTRRRPCREPCRDRLQTGKLGSVGDWSNSRYRQTC